MPAVPYKELRSQTAGTSSAEISARVESARQVQRDRGYYNSQVPPAQLRTICALDDTGERTLEMAMRRMNLSARAHDLLLRVARTIADFRSRLECGGEASGGSRAVSEFGQELLELTYVYR